MRISDWSSDVCSSDLTAKAGPNALAVLAIAEEGCLLNAPDVYMDKLAVGPGYPEGVIDLNKSVADNVRAVAKAKGVQPNEIITCVRSEEHTSELQSLMRISYAVFCLKNTTTTHLLKS